MSGLTVRIASGRPATRLSIVLPCLLVLATLGVSACLPHANDPTKSTPTVQQPQPTATLSHADMEATLVVARAATEQAHMVATLEVERAATDQVHAVTVEAAKKLWPTCHVYDADPNALWNRLFCLLYAEVDEEGKTVGADKLDLNWPFADSGGVLDDAYYNRLIGITDEFLLTHGESLAHSPIERGFLQRDVWKFANEISEGYDYFGDPPLAARLHERTRMVLRRLVPIIRRLAMSRAMIEGLPSNLDQAVAAQAFPANVDAASNSAGDLPSDFAAPNGPWLVLERVEGPLAKVHVKGLIRDMKESALLLMMRGSGDRSSATAFLATLAALEPETADALIVPPGTAFALVRPMMLIDETGTVVPSPVAEEIQIRRYDRHPEVDQFFVAFRVSRVPLFRDGAGGLVKIVAGWHADECARCHVMTSASAYDNYRRGPQAVDEIWARSGPLRATTAENELAASARWLMAQHSFAELKEYW